MRSKICQLLQTSFVNSADFQNLLGCMLAACSAARKRNAVPEAVPEALVSKPESTVARACHGEFDTCCCLGSKLCSETCATCSILAGSVILCIMADLGETGRGQFRDLADLSLLTQRNPKSNHTICVQMFHDTCCRVVLHCCAFFDTLLRHVHMSPVQLKCITQVLIFYPTNTCQYYFNFHARPGTCINVNRHSSFSAHYLINLNVAICC